jgi:hypothetical protein
MKHSVISEDEVDFQEHFVEHFWLWYWYWYGMVLVWYIVLVLVLVLYWLWSSSHVFLMLNLSQLLKHNSFHALFFRIWQLIVSVFL